MKKVIKALSFLVITTMLFAGCNNDSSPEKTAEDNDASAAVGEDVSLTDYRGKVVLIDFWATWCPPCRKGIPDLIELKNEYGDQIEVIGISLDAISRGGATANDVVPFMNEFGINYPVVKGNQEVTMQYGGIQSIPTSFVIDRRGFVISRYVGLVSHDTYKNDIDKALAGDYNREDYQRAPDFTLPTIK